MPILEREFYRSFRGPEIGDEDDWRLVFDPNAPSLSIRHLWHGARHSGVDELNLDEFLAQPGTARDALVRLLFEREMTDASEP
jgi:hypothetical protein